MISDIVLDEETINNACKNLVSAPLLPVICWNHYLSSSYAHLNFYKSQISKDKSRFKFAFAKCASVLNLEITIFISPPNPSRRLPARGEVLLEVAARHPGPRGEVAGVRGRRQRGPRVRRGAGLRQGGILRGVEGGRAPHHGGDQGGL